MSSKQPTIIITGASGFLGSTLVEYFVNKGWRVIGLVRHPKNQEVRKNIRYEKYDITKPVDEALFKGADYLVHTAFVKYDRQHPDAMDINLKGAKNVLAASRGNKLKKNIFLSSMSAHKQAKSVYGKQKLAIEGLFNTNRDVAIRSGLIVGNGGIVKNMVGFMKSKHMVPLIGGGTQPLQIVAVYDLARVIERLLTTKVSGVLTIATPTVYSYKQFYQAIARQLGITVLYVPVPFWVLLGAMRMVSTLHLPLSVNEDNLWGLKMLRSADTAPDLKKIDMTLDSLEEALNHSGVAER
jgi:nucleoside-diphosphate-sugar epimerase